MFGRRLGACAAAGLIACGPGAAADDGATTGAGASTGGSISSGPTSTLPGTTGDGVDTTAGADESSTGGDTDEGGDEGELGDAICPFPAEGEPDPCAEGGCFEMCGRSILRRAVPAALGVETIAAAPRRGFPVSSVVHVGEVGLRNESIGITVRDATAAVLTWLPLAGGPAAGVDDIVLGGVGGIGRPIEVADPAAPILHDGWLPELLPAQPGQGSPPSTGVWLVGTSRGRFVFATPGGISFVDASDPDVPIETACITFSPDDTIVTAGVSDDTLVRIRILGEGTDPPPRVFLHDLDAPDPSITTSELPFGNEGRWAMEGARLMLESAPDMVLYELAHGEAVEIGRRAWTHQIDWGPPVVGGLALVSQSEDGMSYALDLRADGDPAVYVGPRLEPADYDENCLVTFDVVEGSGASLLLSPWYEPRERYDPASPPTHPCPVEPTPPPWGRHGVLAPSGDRVAVSGSDGAVVFDLLDGSSWADGWGEPIAWSSGGLVLAASYQGDAEGTDFEIRDADDPAIVLGELASRGLYLDGALSSTRLWLLTGGGQTPGPERIVWSLPSDDLFGNELDAAVPRDTTLDALVASSTEIYAIDDAGRVLVFDDGGNLLHDLQLPHGAEPTNAAASALGLFVRGTDGVLQWITPGTGAIREDAHGCREWLPRAADDERLFALERDPGGDVFASMESTIALRPTTGDRGTFELTIDALRLPGIAGEVLPGPQLVVLAGSPVWLQ